MKAFRQCQKSFKTVQRKLLAPGNLDTEGKCPGTEAHQDFGYPCSDHAAPMRRVKITLQKHARGRYPARDRHARGRYKACDRHARGDTQHVTDMHQTILEIHTLLDLM